MDTYKVAFSVIKNVVNKELDLKNSLKKESKDATRGESIEISQISGIFFRNYFLIAHLADILNFKKNSDEMIQLGLLYVNNAFRKKVDQNKMFNDFLMYIIQKKHQLSKDEIFYIKDVISRKRTFDFFDVKKGTLKYYSLRFNKPEWLIKLLCKQYGKKEGLSIVYEISAMPQQFVSVNYSKAFSPTMAFKKIDADLYEYTNPTSIRKEESFHDGQIYLTQLGYIEAFSSFDLSNSNLTCYLGDFNNIALDFFKKFVGRNNTLNFVSKDNKLTYKIFDEIKSNKLKETHFYEGNESTLIALLAKKQDLILYSPKCSNFELFRRNPEYGVYFNVDDLDKIINSIKDGLNEVVKYLEVDGTLLYLVPTINLKETHNLINEFIEKNKESFVLDKEKIYLPNKEGNSLLYYAKIRRVK